MYSLYIILQFLSADNSYDALQCLCKPLIQPPANLRNNLQILQPSSNSQKPFVNLKISQEPFFLKLTFSLLKNLLETLQSSFGKNLKHIVREKSIKMLTHLRKHLKTQQRILMTILRM
jgi:hypothetical protein